MKKNTRKMKIDSSPPVAFEKLSEIDQAFVTAIREGDLNKAKFLALSGANLDLKVESPWGTYATPLSLAKHHSSTQLYEMLIAAGARAYPPTNSYLSQGSNRPLPKFNGKYWSYR